MSSVFEIFGHFGEKKGKKTAYYVKYETAKSQL